MFFIPIKIDIQFNGIEYGPFNFAKIKNLVIFLIIKGENQKEISVKGA